MSLKKINYHGKDEVERFIRNAGPSLQKFRYFDSRPLSVLKRHLLTILFYQNNIPIGYGHLDPEEGKIWLGICVSHNALGKGVGKQLMEELMTFAKSNNLLITLSVDSDNTKALNLYNSFGFNQTQKKNSTIFMENK